MTLQLRNVSNDERHAAWTRVIERIYTEQVNQAWSHYMFRLFRAVFVKNERLSEEGGFVFNWIAENYVYAALMLLRRELDRSQVAVEVDRGDCHLAHTDDLHDDRLFDGTTSRRFAGLWFSGVDVRQPV